MNPANRQYRIFGAPKVCACPCTRLTRRRFLGLGAAALPALMAPELPAAVVRHADATGPADFIFHGGTIVTVNAKNARVAALAVRGNKIIAVGGLGQCMSHRGPRTKLINLDGGALLPGFIEPHMHTCFEAQNTWIDVSPLSGVKTIADALAKLKAAAKTLAPGEWIQATGLDPALQSGPQPNVGILDPITPDNPVFMQEDNGHIAHVNSLAFTAAGINDSTSNPSGGVYVHDAQGHLTGRLEEIPAYTAFYEVMPGATISQVRGRIKNLFKQAARAGCTSVHDAGLGLSYGTADLPFLQGIMAENQPVRYTAFLSGYLLDEWDFSKIHPGYGNDRFKITGVKFWMDGSMQAESGFVRQPYLDTDSRGVADYSRAELIGLMRSVADQGWQFAIHANGDAAIDATLDVYREVLGGQSGLARRHRIEHCTLLHAPQIKEMAKMGLSPSFLIGHVYYWGQAFRDHILGPQRSSQLDPCLSALRAGLRISMHSDFNVTTIAPLRYISNAVTRSLYYDQGSVLNAAERITADQGIRAMTLDAAWQCHVDNLVGSLEVGKRADFVVLSDDPAAVHPERIQHLQVRETWLDGVPQLK